MGVSREMKMLMSNHGELSSISGFSDISVTTVQDMMIKSLGNITEVGRLLDTHRNTIKAMLTDKRLHVVLLIDDGKQLKHHLLK